MGHEQHDGQLRQTAGEVVQEPQRRSIGPVRVIDGEQQRSALGEVRRQPVEPVQRRKGAIRRRCGGGYGPQHAGAHCRRPFEERRPNVGPCSVQRRLEQLPHDAVGEVALEVVTSRNQGLHPSVQRERADRADELRLADARRPLQDDDLSGPGTSPPDRRGRAYEFRLAFQ